MIISRTPFRISLFGGGTDYPAWYRQHGGAVLATTIDKFCYLTCRILPPFFDHRIRIVYSFIENCQTVAEIKHPAARAVLEYLRFDRGVEIHHDGDLPARSGMGSSSAFTVGLLHALYGLQGIMRSKRQLAQESIHIEQELLRETVGSQDQVSAAFGGLNHILFQPGGEIIVNPLVVPPARVAELNRHLMLFYTGIKRTAANVADTYIADLEARKGQLELMKELVGEAIAILAGGDDLLRFGHLMKRAWEAKRSLSQQVSNPRVDGLVETAMAAGAIGGKLTGAGGGGFLLLFVPPERQQAVKDALRPLTHVPFTFDQSGSQIIFFDHEQEYPEVERDRQVNPRLPSVELRES